MRLRTLLERATAGQRLRRIARFRPSLVQKVLKDPFWVWCDHHAPRSEAVDETSLYELMLYRRGLEHEQAWVAKNYPDALGIKPDFGYDALRNTLGAMLDGVRAIHQPQLWNLAHDLYGRGDLLVRDDSHASDLGPYHYRVIEIKRARSLRNPYVLQAGFYNRILGRIQGYTPGEVTVALRAQTRRIPTAEHETGLDQAFQRWRELKNGGPPPEPDRPPDATASPWRLYGNRFVFEQGHLLLLAGIRTRERQKLRRAGIDNLEALWRLAPEEVAEILGTHYGRIAYYVGRAYRLQRPLLKPGSALRIPRARRLLYFDFEASDDTHPTEPPHVYLIGCWDGTGSRFVKFLARGAADEARIFEEFIDFAGADIENTRLYHWTEYETLQMARVMRRWPHLEGPLQRLTASCVDLKRAVEDAVYLPVPRFSIKSVAPALGFRWRQSGFGAFESLVCYWDYLDSGDDRLAERAIRYNEDDCMAMWHVDQRLEQLLREHQGP